MCAIFFATIHLGMYIYSHVQFCGIFHNANVLVQSVIRVTKFIVHCSASTGYVDSENSPSVMPYEKTHLV